MQSQFSAVNPSQNVWIDGLIDGYQWKFEDSNDSKELTFKLHKASQENYGFLEQIDSFRSYKMLKSEINTFRDSLNQIQNISSLVFKEQKGKRKSDLNLFITGRSLSFGHAGFANTPNPKYGSKSGTVGLNYDFHRQLGTKLTSTVRLGSFYGISFLHEISHALGLKHPHDKGLNGEPRFPGIGNTRMNYLKLGKFEMNSHPNTQMTYQLFIPGYDDLPRIRDYGYLKTLGTLDIAAIQWIYGINKDYKSGNNRYILPTKNIKGTGWEVLWDTGGIDTIVVPKTYKNATIDLRNSRLKGSNSARTFKSSVDGVVGGFLIAFDWDGIQLKSTPDLCVIENAIGGISGDSLRGNKFDNTLKGKKGDDYISGGSGDDILVGGIGIDTLIGGKGSDVFIIGTKDIDIVKDFSLAQGDEIIVKHKNKSIPLRSSNTFEVNSINNYSTDSSKEHEFIYACDTKILYQLPGSSLGEFPIQIAKFDSGYSNSVC